MDREGHAEWSRFEYGESVSTGDMDEECSGREGLGCHEPPDEIGQHVVGHREQDQLRLRADLGDGAQRYARQQGLGAQA
jgi:hypothetical protein